MGMYTWLSEDEFEKYKKVSNIELNKLFQEVRELMPDVFISERTTFTKRLFRSVKITTSYSLYQISKKPEVRCLNLNLSNEMYVFNYLCGLINGYNYKIEQLNKTNL